MSKAFVYQLTMKELFYLLFGKKICPKCKGTMKKKKCFEIVDGQIFNKDKIIKDTPLYIAGRKEVKHYYDVFICQECGYEIKLDGFKKGKQNG